MSQLFSFEGRVSRSKYWLIFLLSIFVSFVVVLFSILAIPALIFMGTFSPTVASVVSILLYILLIPMWWISIATGVKRFHDRNKSGWWVLISLIPIVGALWILIECGFLKGTAGSNNFGEDSLGGSALAGSFSPTSSSQGVSAGKLIALIIGGVIFIALAGRVIWAWQQVKNDEHRRVVNTEIPLAIVPQQSEVHAPVINTPASATSVQTMTVGKITTTQPIKETSLKEKSLDIPLPLPTGKTVLDCDTQDGNCMLSYGETLNNNLVSCTKSKGTAIVGMETLFGIMRNYEIVGVKDNLCVVYFSFLKFTPVTDGIDQNAPNYSLFAHLFDRSMVCKYSESERNDMLKTKLTIVGELTGCSGPLHEALNEYSPWVKSQQ